MSKEQKLGDRGSYDYTSGSGVVIPLRSLSEKEAQKFIDNRAQWILNGLANALQEGNQTAFNARANEVMQVVAVLVPNDKARKAAGREMREWLNHFSRRHEFVDIFTRIMGVEMALLQGRDIPAQGEEFDYDEDDDPTEEIDPQTANAEKLERLGEGSATED